MKRIKERSTEGNMKTFINATLFILCVAVSANAQLIPVNLNDWIEEGIDANGVWTVSGDGSYVDQSINGAPTFFVSPDTLFNSVIRGTFSVRTTGDDDFIGFVFGYQRPVGEEDYFNFILFDWKQNSQLITGTAQEGFTLCRVEGTVNSDGGNLSGGLTPYWSHADTTMLILDSLYGSTMGWVDNREYLFELNYDAEHITISIDSTIIFDISGNFPIGRFGFYNYSQPNVRYQEFSFNHFPVAQDDFVQTEFMTALNINILENDYDPDNTAITLDHFSQTRHGVVTMLSDSFLTYTPDSTFSGIDSFRYAIYDNVGSGDSANVYITVNPLRLPPLAENDSVTTAFRTMVVISVLDNDYDPDSMGVEIDHVNQPVNGIALQLDGADQHLIEYTPDSSFSGLDSFTYVIRDSLGLMDTATVFVTVDPINAIGEISTVPAIFYLEQNYPNPFNPSTFIKFSLPALLNVKISIYNPLGQKVKIILNKRMESGLHEIQFNAGDLPSGVYFYKIVAGDFVNTKKMILIK